MHWGVEWEGMRHMVTGLDHVQLAMPKSQEDRAREFYGSLLGLMEVAKPQSLAARGGCWFESGRTIVHLGVQQDFIPASKAHPAFTIADLDKLRDRLTRAGYEVIDDNAVPGLKRFYSSDPFGNRLEFIQDGDGFSQRPKDAGD